MKRIDEERAVARRARGLLKRGRAATTAAGPFIEKEIRRRKRNRRQAIAIGISKARRAGIPYARRRK